MVTLGNMSDRSSAGYRASIDKTAVPVLSVITVTLNDKDGLQKTVESVMRQSNIEALEHIVVDGESDYDVAGLLSSLNSQARLVSESDEGLFDAMNKGTRLASGTFLIYMNSGDCFADTDIVDHILKACRQDTPDLVYGDSLERLENGKVVYKRGRNLRWISIGMNTHHQSILYRRETLNKHGIRYNLDYRLAADYEFTLLCSRVSKCSVRLSVPISIFQSGGLSQLRHLDAHREQARIRRMVFGSILFSHTIFWSQRANMMLRKLLPRCYWWLKQ